MVFHVFMAFVFMMVHVHVHAWHVVTSWWLMIMIMLVHDMWPWRGHDHVSSWQGLFMTWLFHAWWFHSMTNDLSFMRVLGHVFLVYHAWLFMEFWWFCFCMMVHVVHVVSCHFGGSMGPGALHPQAPVKIVFYFWGNAMISLVRVSVLF